MAPSRGSLTMFTVRATNRAILPVLWRTPYLLVAIDRTTKFAFVELHEKATRSVVGDFLRALIKAAPYRIHTVLTDKGTHFTSPGNVCSAASDIRQAMDNHEQFRAHAFEYACAQNHIDHRLTKPRHPWTNGQVERTGRTLKDATVKRFHYETHDQLRNHLADFVSAYNFDRRLKTLKGLTPYEAICKTWTSDPGRFTLDPLPQMPGLNRRPSCSSVIMLLYRALTAIS